MNNKYGKRNASIVAWIVLGVTAWLLFSVVRMIGGDHRRMPIIGDPPTLVYGREDLRRIWHWEISSGHYPSTRPSTCRSLAMPLFWLTRGVAFAVPDEIRLGVQPLNPGIPPAKYQRKSATSLGYRSPSTIGTGSKRNYINIEAQSPNIAYPPRVPPGSVADLDVIMENCDFSQQKVCVYVLCSDPVSHSPPCCSMCAIAWR